MNSYIQEETIFWLAGGGDPTVSYLVRRDFPEYFTGSALSSYEAMRSSHQVSSLADRTAVPGDTERYDLLYKGTVWAFAELVCCGLDMHDASTARAAEYIVSSVQTPAGGFSMNWAPPAEAAGWTGDILYYLLASGYEGPAVHKAAEWLTAHQREDGGWLHSPLATFGDLLGLVFLRRSGRGAVREKNSDEKSCFLATVSCGRALALYAKKYGGAIRAVNSASEFVLSGKRLLEKKVSGGEGYMTNFRYDKLSYPVLCQQDLLSTLLFLAEAGKLGDKRAARAFNSIMAKRRTDGTFPCESKEPGTLSSKYGNRNGLADKWVTLQALRLMRYL
jgi:hypothetical protein